MKQLFFTICLFCCISGLSQSSIYFKTLLCQNIKNPIAINDKNPQFTWIIDVEGYNREQSAYQIVVSSSKMKIDKNLGDLWNSKKVQSTNSAHVSYAGNMLKPGQKYWWKVRIWDNKGNRSEWSTVQSFQLGLLVDSNWSNAQWISLGQDTRTSEFRFRDYKTGRMLQPVPVTSQAVGYFRNLIHVEKEIDHATAYVCGLGYYELSVNGNKVGDHVLDPAPSNYDKQSYYVCYDITEELLAGSNVLGLILGNGFYGQSISWKRDPESERDMSYGVPAARMLVRIAYKDGSTEVVTTNKHWKSTTGPIVFDNVYGGDTYDARFELKDWNTVNCDDSKWNTVKIIQPKVKKLSAQMIAPIRRLHTFAPQSIFQSPDGNWVVDFGQNIAGWVKIKVKGKRGQPIFIQTVEALTKNGNDIYPGSTGGGANGMKQEFCYVCKGEGLEIWEPKFSYHGFRYAKISGLDYKPSEESITAVMVATDTPQTGYFHCSNALYNQMDTVSQWTIIDNLHGIPEDCPHREKCGWLGDAHAFCEYAFYNYDMANFYKKYMVDIQTQMKSTTGANNDKVRYKVPTMIAPGKRTSSIAKLDWGVATMYIPWYSYLHTGDKSLAVEYYQDMKQLTNYYLSFKNEKGIVDNGMGDWCPPRWDRKRNPIAMECHPVVSANAYFYDILGCMRQFAVLNNDAELEKYVSEEQQKLKNAFNKEYLQSIPLTSFLWYGSQTATVMALQFGMVPEKDLNKVVDGLCHNIIAVKGGHHAVGIHGNRYLYTVLTEHGKAELAHQILTTPSFPSQTYVLNYGFTTWPERQFYWNDMDGLSNSLNHPMHSGFAAYFYENVGGVKPSRDCPGYKEFWVHPIFSKQITHSEIDVPTSYGTIENDWFVENGEMTMSLAVPFNTQARVVVEESYLKTLRINGKTIKELDLNVVKESTQNYIKVGSGDYTIHYHL